MKVLYTSVFAALALTAVSAHAGSKFDMVSQSYADAYMTARLNPQVKQVQLIGAPFDLASSRGGEQSACLAELADGYTVDDVYAFGLDVTSEIENYIVAEGAVEDIIRLAESDVVTTVSFAREMQPMLDRARAVSGVDDVHKGTGLDAKYRGAGVVAGIFDQGIDPNHINFYNSDFTHSRVKRFWHFTTTGGGSPREYTESNLGSATTDNAADTHGTHTLGCMAGGYNRAGSSAKYPKGSIAVSKYDDNGAYTSGSTSSFNKVPYYGSAPDADIAACGGSLTDANILAGVERICEYAKAEGKPCVINLSIGITTGPHDGSSSFSKRLDAYAKKYGAIICVAAGNDGDNNFTISKSLTSADKQVKTFICSGASAFFGAAQIYASDNKNLSVSFALCNPANGSVVYTFNNDDASGTKVVATKEYNQTGYAHDAQFVNNFSNSYVMISKGVDNNRTTSTVTFNLRPTAETLVPAIIIEGAAGQRVDIVAIQQSGSPYLSSRNLSGWENATPDFSVSDMATGKEIICVGAWNTRHQWRTTASVYSYNGASAVNEVADYSSYGKLVDGRSLPHVLAPGTGIISSYNSHYVERYADNTRYYNPDADCAALTWNNRKYVWQVEQGTSMATPFVAGTIATWLQAFPQLTVADARRILMETATKDSYTAKVSPVKAGAGKLNAYKGMQEVIKLRNAGGVNDILADSNDDDVMVSSPARGVYEVFTGAVATNVVLYNLNGVPVASAYGTDAATLDASSQPAGIYVLNINGKGRRVAIH